MNGHQALENNLLNHNVDLNMLQKATPIQSNEEIRQAWLQQRLGKFTASEFYRLLTYPNKAELPAGGITYATEKAVELLTDTVKSSFVNEAMQWGLDHEMDAIRAFERAANISITATGTEQAFITKGDAVGGTPDGLIGDGSGIEIKCPNSITHLKYRQLRTMAALKTTCPNHYWQIQGLMYITERTHRHFVSYDPRYTDPQKQLYCLTLTAEQDDHAFLAKRLSLAIECRNTLLNII